MADCPSYRKREDEQKELVVADEVVEDQEPVVEEPDPQVRID